jgi:5-methylcytosine-specific restriction endonuclease McrA
MIRKKIWSLLSKRSHAGKSVLRNSRRKALGERFTKTERKLVLVKFSNRCFKCKATSQKGNPLQIDHHYPLSRGFKLTLDNAVVLCKRCNEAKGSSLPQEFYSTDELELLKERYKIG